jgi:monothiol glutaredoxin
MNKQEVQDWIGKQVARNDVVLFMKGTKQMPQCGFSMQVAQILNHLGVDFKDINVLDDMSVREGIKAYSNWPTIPQLYVKGEFIGGCDIVREMLQAGELQELLTAKGIAHNAQTLAPRAGFTSPAEQVEGGGANCNCSYGCPRQFNAPPTHGHCRGLAVVDIEKGFHGEPGLTG